MNTKILSEIAFAHSEALKKHPKKYVSAVVCKTLLLQADVFNDRYALVHCLDVYLNDGIVEINRLIVNENGLS